MDLNDKKYPVSLCNPEVSQLLRLLIRNQPEHDRTNWPHEEVLSPFSYSAQIDKYVCHSQQTGYDKHNQSIDLPLTYCASSGNVPVVKNNELAWISQQSLNFVLDRGWEHHDTEMNLCLALASEVGELADLVAWVNSNQGIRDGDFTQFTDKFAQELADITILAVRFSTKLGVDLLNIKLDSK